MSGAMNAIMDLITSYRSKGELIDVLILACSLFPIIFCVKLVRFRREIGRRGFLHELVGETVGKAFTLAFYGAILLATGFLCWAIVLWIASLIVSALNWCGLIEMNHISISLLVVPPYVVWFLITIVIVFLEPKKPDKS
jgi:hypothetical protein